MEAYIAAESARLHMDGFASVFEGRKGAEVLMSVYFAAGCGSASVVRFDFEMIGG